MSNPGVYYLSSSKALKLNSFRVEDNIGECIHIHYGNLRLDFTIREFLQLSIIMEKAVYELSQGLLNFDDIDVLFFEEIAHELINLKEVQTVSYNLSELKVSRRYLKFFSKWDKLNQSRVFKALNGNVEENNEYKQRNRFNISNQERVEDIKEFISENHYPTKTGYIVLINDQAFIRDGQHRAASLLHSKGDIPVEVKVLRFYTDNLSLSERRVIQSFLSVSKEKLRLILRKVKRRILF